MSPTTCTKRFDNLPFAHRQPNHAGHCSLIHGHNWAFEFEFTAKAVDSNGFVIDFGDLKWLRTWLEERFDHTLVLNEDDPYLQDFHDFCDGREGDMTVTPKLMPSARLAKIVTVRNCGAEGLAQLAGYYADSAVRTMTHDRVRVLRCTVFEDTRNSATFTLPH